MKQMISTFSAKASEVGKTVKVVTQARNFELVIDEPPRVGGNDEGMTPLEAYLCAIGSCMTITSRILAESQQFIFDNLYVEIEGDVDFEGLLKGTEGIPKRFQEIRYTFNFKTQASQEETEVFVNFIESRCPLLDSFDKAIRLVKKVVITE